MRGFFKFMGYAFGTVGFIALFTTNPDDVNLESIFKILVAIFFVLNAIAAWILATGGGKGAE